MADFYQIHGGYKLSKPSRAFHQIITTRKHIPTIDSLDLGKVEHRCALLDMLKLAQNFVDKNGLAAYSLIINNSSPAPDQQLAIHLVSGAYLTSQIDPATTVEKKAPHGN